MQNGQVKHYNSEKGYGFIDVDNQSEDVFFHVSKVRLSQPITIGQRVYFNSERNDKNQLRASEVTDASLSIEESAPTSNHAPIPSNQDNRSSRNNHSNSNSQNNRRNKKSWKSTAISILTLIAIVFFGYTELKPILLEDNVQSTSAPSSSYVETNARGITGDPQIDQTIALIQQGGPFPYPNKDGTTFYNREGRLPAQSQGYYREYTIPTPGVSHRGARRIVTGGNPPTVYYLTVDHYDSFRKLQVN